MLWHCILLNPMARRLKSSANRLLLQTSRSSEQHKEHPGSVLLEIHRVSHAKNMTCQLKTVFNMWFRLLYFVVVTFEIIMGMGFAIQSWRYNVTSSLTGWSHTQSDPWLYHRTIISFFTYILQFYFSLAIVRLSRSRCQLSHPNGSPGNKLQQSITQHELCA